MWDIEKLIVVDIEAAEEAVGDEAVAPEHDYLGGEHASEHVGDEEHIDQGEGGIVEEEEEGC